MDLYAIQNEVKGLVTAKDRKPFIYDLLLAYHLPKTSVARLKKGTHNLTKEPGEVLWKNRLCFVHETEVDIHVRGDVQLDALLRGDGVANPDANCQAIR